PPLPPPEFPPLPDEPGEPPEPALPPFAHASDITRTVGPKMAMMARKITRIFRTPWRRSLRPFSVRFISMPAPLCVCDGNPPSTRYLFMSERPTRCQSDKAVRTKGHEACHDVTSRAVISQVPMTSHRCLHPSRCQRAMGKGDYYELVARQRIGCSAAHEPVGRFGGCETTRS